MVHKKPRLYVGSSTKSTIPRILKNYQFPNCVGRYQHMGMILLHDTKLVKNSFKRYGMPREGLLSLRPKIRKKSYSINMAHRSSFSTYQATSCEFNAGAGLRSFLAPFIWNTIITQILHMAEDIPNTTIIQHFENQEEVVSRAKPI